MTSSRSAGRAGLWLLVALALGAVAFLLVADPLGLLGGAGGRDKADEAGGAELASDRAAAGTPPAPDVTVNLEGLYGSGDLGSVRLRVLDARTKQPRKAHGVTLRHRNGTETVLASDADGVALFPRVAPGRGWQVLVAAAEGLRAVTLEGVAVKPSVLTDLGDVWLGQNVVLRGRVLSPTGKPLPGASVAVYTPATGAAGQGLIGFLVEQVTAVPTPREQVATDGDGWFGFTTLTDGTYSLVARHAGFGTRQQNDVVVSARSGSSPLVVRLGEGATMSGKVLDGDGKPVAGARVVAMRDLGNRWSMTGTLERDEATSDARGQYALDTLVDGATYRFGVVADGFASAWDSQTTEVQQKLERDFTLSRGGWIEGRVTEEGTGNPVADASLSVVIGRMNFGGGGRARGGRGGPGPGAPGTPGSTDPTTPALARTDAQGRFRIGPLLPGPVMSAVVKARGYTTYSSSNNGFFNTNPWPDVTLETLNVDVALKRGGSIQGLVKDVEGRPIANANVLAAAGGMQAMTSMWTGSPVAVTDVQGRYQIDGVPPGDYHLTADAPGFAFAEAGSDATKVTVTEGGSAATLDLVLAAAGVVTGTVTDGKGEPLAGVRVRTRADFGNLFGGGGGRGGRGGGAAPTGGGAGAGARVAAALRTSADLTDAEGKFRLDGVGTAIDWTVEAEAEEYVPAQSERLRLKAGEVKEVALVLTGGATLAGYVVGEGGSRVAGARLRVGTLEGDDVTRPYLSAWQADRLLDARVFVSDAEGKFVIPNVKPGRVAVKAEHPDYVTYFKRNVTLQPDQVQANYVVLLPKGEVVEGVVKGADGRPLENAFVVVSALRNPGPQANEPVPAEPSEDVEPAMNARTDKDGKFRVENIPPGTWNVVVGFAAGHTGWFGTNDESAIAREVRVPARDVEFRLKAAEPGANPFGGGRVQPPAPRPAGGGTGTGGGGVPPR